MPELTEKPGAPGVPTQKVTGFANCDGSLYVTINTKLYRRNDGDLSPGVARWVLLYHEPPVGMSNSGLRGLTCITHLGSPSLLLSTESGVGDVYRIDHLPRGQLDDPPRASPGHGLRGLIPILQFAPIPALRHMLAAEGNNRSRHGHGVHDYVMWHTTTSRPSRSTASTDNSSVWSTRIGGCPPARVCGPTAYGAATFDGAACFAIRTDARIPTYSLRCLSRTGLRTLGHGGQADPLGPGIRLHSHHHALSVRRRAPLLRGLRRNFYPADGTAWIASSTPEALHLTASSKGRDT